MSELASSGRTIVGFDLCEVAPDQSDEDNHWDANVGARMLYKLCGFTLKTNPRKKKQVSFETEGCCDFSAVMRIKW